MSSGVEFDVDKAEYETRSPARPYTPGPGNSGTFSGGGNEPKMVKWLMKKGVIKSAGAGQAILVGLVLVNLLITYVVVAYFL